MAYKNLSKELEERILADNASGNFQSFACKDESAIRRISKPHEEANLVRSAFIRDVDKILNCPYYNRYSDKTQVISLYKNDDITHRSLHVQLVSRIARTIGKALRLNLELIEAIALGHDIGHTPFGHTGERFLDELYREKTGRRFNHNIHSVRVLDTIFPLNVSLQTLNGIAAHNGEMELNEYLPCPFYDFAEFDKLIEGCYQNGENVKKLQSFTLEGCVMRISDIIAYLGKDRHDAEKSKVITPEEFQNGELGKINAEIVNNLVVNIIEESYGKDRICLDKEHFAALKTAKNENYERIYKNEEVKKADETLKLMARELYEKLLADLKNGVKSSPVFTHHIEYLNKPYYHRAMPYEETEKNQIIVDYIASMTDDYFIDLYKYLLPNGKHEIHYKGYFD